MNIAKTIIVMKYFILLITASKSGTSPELSLSIVNEIIIDVRID